MQTAGGWKLAGRRNHSMAVFLWYYGIGCRKMPDTKKKAGQWMDRNVNIITDLDGTKIVLINDIVFRGKRSVKWKDVEQYLRQYIGEFYTVTDTEEVVYTGSDLPDEYVHSNYTKKLKGTSAKAKANAAQGLPEMIETATGKQFEENEKRSMGRMRNTGGTVMNLGLRFRYMMKTGRLKGIMSFTS